MSESQLPQTRLFVWNQCWENQPLNDKFKKMGAFFMRNAFARGLAFYAMSGITPSAMQEDGARLYGGLYAVTPLALAFMDTIVGNDKLFGIKRTNKKVYAQGAQGEEPCVAWVHYSHLNICGSDKPYRDVYEWAKYRASLFGGQK